MADSDQVRVTVVAPMKPGVSETFIRAHLERLPGVIDFLYGGTPPLAPKHTASGEPILSPALLPRLIAGTERFLRRETWEQNMQRRMVGLVAQRLRKTRTDVVLAEYGPSGVRVMEACRQSGVPLVVHFHGYDAYMHETLETIGQSYPAMFSNARSIIAVSEDMKSQLLSLGAAAEKVRVNPYGVDTSLFSKARPEANPPVFLAVGRFVDKKAPYLTLLAFSRVLTECGAARLVMIGEGHLLESCRRLVTALGIAEQVCFKGVCDHAEVASAMQSARAFVQHSIRPMNGDSEGTPVGILEAGASGLPVVATRHAGIPEAVVDGETGLLVNEGDVDEMAASMVRLVRKPDYAAQLGSAAAARIAELYSMDRHISRLHEILLEATQ